MGMRIGRTMTAALLAAGTLLGPGEARGQAPEAVAVADSLSRMVHRGAVVGDAELLQSARRLAQRALTAYPDHPLLEHYLAETYYREATRLAAEDMDAAQAVLERAQDILDVTVERPGAIPESHALRGSVIGMRITNMLKGMTMGPRADRALSRALDMDPANPRVWLAKGISTLHKPGFTGGGPEAALEEFQRGIALLESDEPARGHPVGGGAELWAWVGRAHLRMKQPGEAVSAFERALELEPEFGWVRHVLLPEALNAAQ